MCRARTTEEVREDFLEHLRSIADYWAKIKGQEHLDVINSVLFSVLSLTDGCHGDFPAVDLIVRPHEDDKQYHIDNGDDWIEDGTCINGDVMLHEMWYPR